jgi:hypothetical protein
MFEIRIYRMPDNRSPGTSSGTNKIRIGTIKKSGEWFGLVAWIRLWFTLRKFKQKMENEYRAIAADRSPRISH